MPNPTPPDSDAPPAYSGITPSYLCPPVPRITPLRPLTAHDALCLLAPDERCYGQRTAGSLTLQRWLSDIQQPQTVGGKGPQMSTDHEGGWQGATNFESDGRTRTEGGPGPQSRTDTNAELVN